MKREGTATITNLEHHHNHHAENIPGLRRSMANFMNLSFFSNRQLFEPLFIDLGNKGRGIMFKPVNLNIKVGDLVKYKIKNNKVYIMGKIEEEMVNEKEYSINNVQKYFKDNYGLEISENPTEKEQKRMFRAWAEKMNQTIDKIISNQDSMLLELDETIKKIDSLDKKSR